MENKVTNDKKLSEFSAFIFLGPSLFLLKPKYNFPISRRKPSFWAKSGKKRCFCPNFICSEVIHCKTKGHSFVQRPNPFRPTASGLRSGSISIETLKVCLWQRPDWPISVCALIGKHQSVRYEARFLARPTLPVHEGLSPSLHKN